MIGSVKTEKIAEQLLAVALMAVAFSIPLPIRINSIISMTALACYMATIWQTKHFDTGFVNTVVFILIFIQAGILLLGLLHTSDIPQGFADIERFGYVLLLPFLLYQSRHSSLTTLKLVASFAAGCTALILYGLTVALFGADPDSIKKVWELGHTYITDPMDIHPTYLSIYILFVVFFLLEVVRTKRMFLRKSQVLLIIFGVLFLISFLLLIRSQMGLLLFLILFVLYLVVVLKRRAWLVTFILFTIGLLVFLLDPQRVSTFFDTYGKNVSSALDNRFHVWKGAVEAIKTSPIIGGGTGAEHEMLNKAYLKIGYLEGELNSYNAHNQYLEFLVQNGPVHLLAFLTLLVYSFKQSLRFPNHLFLLFCMMFTLIMFFESSLQLHKGVVFFYFFLGCFLFLRFDDQHKATDSPKNS